LRNTLPDLLRHTGREGGCRGDGVKFDRTHLCPELDGGGGIGQLVFALVDLDQQKPNPVSGAFFYSVRLLGSAFAHIDELLAVDLRDPD
jgi:hypothetical protein